MQNNGKHLVNLIPLLTISLELCGSYCVTVDLILATIESRSISARKLNLVPVSVQSIPGNLVIYQMS